jgi:hypothetical protein
MKKQNIFLLAILFLTSKSFAQTSLEKIYKDSIINLLYEGISDCDDFISTSDNNYILLGHTNVVSQGSRTCILKLNSDFDTTWTTTIGFGSEEIGCNIKQCSDGGYIIAGTSRLIGSLKPYVARLDSVGRVDWLRIYYAPSHYFNNIIQNSNGTFTLLGSTASGSFNQKLFLINIDPLGSVNWYKQYKLDTASTVLVDAYSLISLPNNECALTASKYIPGKYSMIFIKIDSIGIPIWIQNISSNDNLIRPFDVIVSNNEYLITGGISQNGSSYLFTAKTNSLGDLIWSYTFGEANSSFENRFKSILLKDNNYLTLGTSYFNNDDHYSLIKTDTSGNIIWSKLYGGSGFEHSSGLSEDVDGSLRIAGTSASFNYHSLYLLKTDSLGNSNCNDSSISIQNSFVPFISQVAYIQTDTLTINWFDTMSYKTTLYENISLCPTATTISSNRITENASIYPNPFTDAVTFKMSNANPYKLIITNLTGQLKYEAVFENEITLHDLNYPNGIYFYKISNGLTNITGKIIKL